MYATATFKARHARAHRRRGRDHQRGVHARQPHVGDRQRDGRRAALGHPERQALGAPLPGVPSSPVIPAFTRTAAIWWRLRERARLRVGHPPAVAAAQACRVAGRRLTRAEWDEFLPGREYDPAC